MRYLFSLVVSASRITRPVGQPHVQIPFISFTARVYISNLVHILIHKMAFHLKVTTVRYSTTDVMHTIVDDKEVRNYSSRGKLSEWDKHPSLPWWKWFISVHNRNSFLKYSLKNLFTQFVHYLCLVQAPLFKSCVSLHTKFKQISQMFNPFMILSQFKCLRIQIV